MFKKTDYRDTTVVVSKKAYRENIRFFQEKCTPAKVMPVIKADGYGHGAFELAQAAGECGCDFFAVAFLSEALELRKKGIKSDILILNYFNPNYIDELVKQGLHATIYSWEQYQKLRENCTQGVIQAHVIVDTGMSRIGFDFRNAKEPITKIINDEKFKIDGLYTHFASADEVDKSFTELQAYRFNELVRQLPPIKTKHISNSAGALFEGWEKDLNKPEYDFVRLGIAAYGLDPKSDEREKELMPVLKWETRVAMVKTIKKGTSISYGRTFIADKDLRVATIPVGYADGYNRLLSNKGEVLIQGRRCPVLGRVCMDQFVVCVDHLQDVRQGDECVLLGRMGDEEISAEEIAARIDTINYEVTCSISKRVPRQYI